MGSLPVTVQPWEHYPTIHPPARPPLVPVPLQTTRVPNFRFAVLTDGPRARVGPPHEPPAGVLRIFVSLYTIPPVNALPCPLSHVQPCLSMPFSVLPLPVSARPCCAVLCRVPPLSAFHWPEHRPAPPPRVRLPLPFITVDSSVLFCFFLALNCTFFISHFSWFLFLTLCLASPLRAKLHYISGKFRWWSLNAPSTVTPLTTNTQKAHTSPLHLYSQ